MVRPNLLNLNKQDAEIEADRLESMGVPFQVLLSPNGLWEVKVELLLLVDREVSVDNPSDCRPIVESDSLPSASPNLTDREWQEADYELSDRR